jgi:hypothetical protein
MPTTHSPQMAPVTHPPAEHPPAGHPRATHSPPGHRAAGHGTGMAAALRPLVIDVGVPVGTYYLLHGAFGVSVWLSLVLSSTGPFARTVAGAASRRQPGPLPVLMLVVNVTGIVVSLLSGDPQAVIAKDSAVSSVIAFCILGSVVVRRPLMSAGLKPFVTKGMPDRAAAWDRLSAACTRFRRLELLFSAIWGSVLLADCVARVAGAYLLPVATMAWLGSVLAMGAIALAMVLGGVAASPIMRMIEAEETAAAPAPAAS